MKITTTKQTNMMEMGRLTSSGIVIFGATGDLCKKKLIPALIISGRKIYFQKILSLLDLLDVKELQISGKNLLLILVIILKIFYGI